MASDAIGQLLEARRLLEAEMMELRDQIQKREAALRSLDESIRAYRAAESLPAKPADHANIGSRRGLSKREGHYDHLLFRGQQFETVGDFLDFVGEPHYFSPMRGHQKDAAQRQIFRWAREHRAEAEHVMLIKGNGEQVTLSDFMTRHGIR